MTFDGLEPRRCEDIKGIVAPEVGPKSFGTFKKQAPGRELNPRSALWHCTCTSKVLCIGFQCYAANSVHIIFSPQDVLATLLNNLKVQERQNRVCTTVAIAIVAETCSPFTVLPALMNEYRVPELNVQNGVLKSLSFLFEYIGEMGKDYIYAVTPLLEDALMDRLENVTFVNARFFILFIYLFGLNDTIINLRIGVRLAPDGDTGSQLQLKWSSCQKMCQN